MIGFNTAAWQKLQTQQAARQRQIPPAQQMSPSYQPMCPNTAVMPLQGSEVQANHVSHSSGSGMHKDGDQPDQCELLGYSEELDEHFRKPNAWEFEKDMAAAENRASSLETLAIVAALLAGFAANDASTFDSAAPSWSTPQRELYAFCLMFTFSGNLFISVSGALTVMACKRVHSWDVKLMKKHPDDIFKKGDYVNTMRMLFGSDEEKWLQKASSRDDDQNLVLKLPLNYWVFKNMCEGVCSLTGFGVTLFPFTTVLYLVAIALNFSKGADWIVQTITWSLIAPWVLVTFYCVHKMVTLFMM